MGKKNYSKAELSMHAIISGVLLNGYIQGNAEQKLNTEVIDVAIKEILKICSVKGDL